MGTVVDIARRAERDARPLEERLVIPTKLCVRCRDEKLKEEFTHDRRLKDGLSSYCKQCRSDIANKYNKEKRGQDWINRVLSNARVSYGSAKRRPKILAWEPMNIDREYLLDLYRYQEGKCVYFNIPMLLEGGMDPRSISLDRIDCSRGYVQGNVVLACRAANLGRGAASVDQMLMFVEMIKRS